MRHFAFPVLAAGAAFFSLTASAQDATALTPADARQCAIWASYVSIQMADDPPTAEALLQAMSYFVGSYEGQTGRSIVSEDDAAAVAQVVGNIEAVTVKCAGYMAGYGDRLVAWGAALETALDDSERKPGS